MGLASSEKQVPQVIENREGKVVNGAPLESVGTRPRQERRGLPSRTRRSDSEFGIIPWEPQRRDGLARGTKLLQVGFGGSSMTVMAALSPSSFP